MRAEVFLVLAFAVSGLAAAPVAAWLAPPATVPDGARCGAYPCGPIPVSVVLELEKTRDHQFNGTSAFTVNGTVSYKFDVDQDGYVYHPDEKPVITWHVPRPLPWIVVTATPERIPVPVDDAQYIQADQNNPGQSTFFYEHPVSVTVTKTRDPTAQELEAEVRFNGQYVVMVAAETNPSRVGAGGYSVGLDEGFGPRQLHIRPDPVAAPAEDVADAPATGMGAALGALFVAGLVTAFGHARRRRRWPRR